MRSSFEASSREFFDILKNAARALRPLQGNQIEADRRQMLRGRIMQVLRDPLAFVVLNTQDALRQVFGFELRDFVVGNVAENTAGPKRFCRFRPNRFSPCLQPARLTIGPNDAKLALAIVQGAEGCGADRSSGDVAVVGVHPAEHGGGRQRLGHRAAPAWRGSVSTTKGVAL